MLYRMKQNAVGLANICILSTMVLVTVSTTVSLYAGLEGALERMYPYDVDVVQSLDAVPPEQEPTALEQRTLLERRPDRRRGRRPEGWNCSAGPLERVDTVGYYTGNTFTLVAQEGVSTRDPGCSPPMTTAASPAIPWTWSRKRCWSRQRILDLPDTFYIEDLPFHIAGTIMDFPRYNSSILISGQTAQLFLVVADETVVLRHQRPGCQRESTGNFVSRWTWTARKRKSWPLWTPCWRRTPMTCTPSSAIRTTLWTCTPCTAASCSWACFWALLFLLSTVLIIYYKQISEGYEDQRRYQIMQQVGMSPREVRSSIRSQVLLVFFLPLATAGIHVVGSLPHAVQTAGAVQPL